MKRSQSWLRISLLSSLVASPALTAPGDPIYEPPPECGIPQAYDFQFLTGIPFSLPNDTEDQRTSLAAAGGFVFWSEPTETPIMRADFDTQEVTPLANRMDSPQGVVVTDSAVLWLEERDGTIPRECSGPGVRRQIHRSARDGSDSMILGEWPDCGRAGTSLVADDTSLYFVTAETSPRKYLIRRAPLDGGSGEILVDLGALGDYVFSLALDDQYLYWTERGDPPTGSMVRRVPKLGGAPETLMDGFFTPRLGLLLLGDELVFPIQDTLAHARILKMPKTGGAPTTLVEIPPLPLSDTSPRGIASDGAFVYWFDSSSLYSVPLAGGVAVTLATGFDNPEGMASEGGYVYWTESTLSARNQGVLRRVPSGGGAVATVASKLQKPGPPLVQGSDVYWPERYRIAAVPVSGGPVSTVVSGVPGEYARIATDGVNVYLQTRASASILTVPVDGGQVENLAPTGDYPVSDIATDGINVYWLENNASVHQVPTSGGPSVQLSGGTTQGASLDAGPDSVFWIDMPVFEENTIRKVPIDGGATTTLTDGDTFIDLVVDETSVYYANRSTGIYRMDATGGASERLAPGSDYRTRLAQNTNNLFWLTQNAVSGVSKDGGARAHVALLVSEHLFPNDIAVDGWNVYFTDFVNRRIVRAVPRPPGSFAFAAPKWTVSESAKIAPITVKRTSALDSAASVRYWVSDGSASAGADYLATLGALSFPPGVSARTFTVPILEDREHEESETLLLKLGGCALIASQGTAVLAIKDNDPVPTLQFSTAKYAGSEAKGAASITVNRRGSAAVRLTVDFTTSGGTATPGQDYTVTGGTLTFEPGVLSQSFSFPITDDAVADPGETVTLALSQPRPDGAAGLGSMRTAAIAIADNDQGLQFSAPAYTAAETAPKAIITVKRVGNTAGSASIDYAATGGSATNGADYTLSPGTLSFLPGQLARTFSVSLHNDADVEGSETVELTLSNAVGATVVGANSTLLTITDREPVFQFVAPIWPILESAPSRAITVKRTGPLGSPAVVDYRITGGTAAAGMDFSGAPTGTLAFAAGKATAVLTIAPIDDFVDEPPETVIVTLENPSAGYGIGTPNAASLTINDNDTAGTAQFSVADYSVAEDRDSVTITVTRAGGTSEASVDFATIDGTARAGANYIAVAGTLLFGPRETKRTFTVEVLDDGTPGMNSFLRIALTNPTSGLTLGALPTATLWIVESE